MQHPQDPGTFTTISATVGGVMKAVSLKPILMIISLGSLTELVVYAVASASVGYVVKRILDKIYNRFFGRSNNSNSQGHE